MDIQTIDANKSCFCFAFRRASRSISQRYDHIFSTIGIRSTQFNLLAGLAHYQAKTLTDLAVWLVMDRTTLTRNLKPLERAGWIQCLTSSDKRSRPYTLTPAGLEILQKAMPLWKSMQDQVHKVFGQEYCDRTIEELNKVVEQSKSLN